MQLVRFTLLSALLLVLISCGQEETKNKEVSAPKKNVTIETTAIKEELPPIGNFILGETKLNISKEKFEIDTTKCNWNTEEQVIAKAKKIRAKREKDDYQNVEPETCDAYILNNETISKNKLQYELSNQIKNIENRITRNEEKLSKKEISEKINSLENLKNEQLILLNKINNGDFKKIKIEQYLTMFEMEDSCGRYYYFMDGNNLINISWCNGSGANDGYDYATDIQKVNIFVKKS